MICNGYKDEEYVETALLSTQARHRRRCIVVEKFTELETILRVSRRARASARRSACAPSSAGAGSGRWQESGGDRSKFGLTTRQIVQLVEALEDRGHARLPASSCTSTSAARSPTSARSRTRCARPRARWSGCTAMGARIRCFDVGGGLGVDYDGSSTNFESSMNYSLQEYANDVVYHLAEACEEAEIPQPDDRDRVGPRADRAPRGARGRGARRRPTSPTVGVPPSRRARTSTRSCTTSH